MVNDLQGSLRARAFGPLRQKLRKNAKRSQRRTVGRAIETGGRHQRETAQSHVR
jgi:hypothetical protein